MRDALEHHLAERFRLRGAFDAAADSAEALATLFRSGKRPDGQAVSSVMPFLALREMNDTDVRALYLHLKTLAPKPAGQR